MTAAPPNIDPNGLEGQPLQQLSEAVDANFGSYVIRNFLKIKAILIAWLTPQTQITIGAAGGAANLPAKPVGYILVPVNGTMYAVPYYNAS